MKKFQAADQPISQPDRDLLGMESHAKQLADFLDEVDLPFTLGVYGEWGEGKTSFVRLLEHFLRQFTDWKDLVFIEFSAWPYTTSDTVWRALLLKIAAKMYDVDEEANSEKPLAQGVIPTIGNFLGSDAVILQSPQKEIDNEERYKLLVAKIDRSTTIANHAQGAEIDYNNAMVALSTIFFEVGGVFSPFLQGIRKIFGFGDAVKIGDLVRAQVGEGKREIVQSVEDIRKELRKMFDLNKNKRLVVLIDDLDRCMPEVALDVLELVKIFFFESEEVKAECLFIIAADEELIGKGLIARFRNSVNGDSPSNIQNILQKGQEYFEKIIQFGIRLPEKDFDQCHNFMTTHFPTWACTTDILYTAIGTNPRRLKQYCNLLSYREEQALKKPTEKTQDTDEFNIKGGTTRNREIFEKLVQIQLLSSECSELIQRIAKESDSYSREMKALELKANEEKGPLGKKATVREAFLNPPLLSEQEPKAVEILVDFADTRIGNNGILESHDPVFQYIVERVSDKGGKINVDQFLAEIFATIFGIEQMHPYILEWLVELTKTPYFDQELREIEKYIDELLATENDKMLYPQLQTEFGRNILKALDTIIKKSGLSHEESWLFLNPPRLSHLTSEQILAYMDIKESFYGSEKKLNPNFKATKIDKWRTATSKAIDFLDKKRCHEVAFPLRLRKKLAIDFLSRRKFVKVLALDKAWPSISKRIQREGVSGLTLHALRELEKTKSEQEITEVLSSLPDRARNYFPNDITDFLSFLRLPPFFQEIYDEELTDFLVASQISLKPMVFQEPSNAVGDTSKVAVPLDNYENLTLKIDSKEFDPLKSKDLDITISVAREHKAAEEMSFKEEILLKINAERLHEIDELLSILPGAYLNQIQTTQTRKATVIGPPDPEELLKQIGIKLFDCFFADATVRAYFLKSLEGERVRVILDASNPVLAALPWESLYLPNFREFLSRTLRFSLVRHVPEPTELASHALEPPLRILGVFANPDDYPPIDLEQEKDVLKQTLAQSIKEGYVELKTLDNASIELLMSELRSFQPHVLHFGGHGAIRDEMGYIVLVDDSLNAHWLSSLELGRTLQDYNINLAVLNGCSTGITGPDNFMYGVAQAVVRQGVPAAISTMRDIQDKAALTFTREFYRSLADGFPIEGAIIEARKTLSLKKWDWSAYVLFSGSKELQDLRLVKKRGRNNRGD